MAVGRKSLREGRRRGEGISEIQISDIYSWKSQIYIRPLSAKLEREACSRPRSGLSRMLIMRADVLHPRVTIFVVEARQNPQASC